MVRCRPEDRENIQFDIQCLINVEYDNKSEY